MDSCLIRVRRCLRSKELSFPTVAEVEQLGVEAFVCLLHILAEEALSDAEKSNALRLMSLLTRQQYPKGKIELIQWASRLARDDSSQVRSTACHVAIWGLMTLEDSAGELGDRAGARQTAHQAIVSALSRGIDPSMTELAQQFLRQRSWFDPEQDRERSSA